MSRNHIHFSQYYLKDKPISGMRGDCDLFIELDAAQAYLNGYKFLISTNEVILSQGINGVIPSRYFKQVF